HRAAVVQMILRELPELARVQGRGALDPGVERIRRDRVELAARRGEVVPAIVDADLDLRVRDDGEVVLGEESRGERRHERLDLGHDDVLYGRIDAHGARRDAGAE